MAKKECRARLPWQTRRVHPPCGKPHPGVIVEVTGSHQFVDEMIDHHVARLHFLYAPDSSAIPHFCETDPIIIPDLRTQREPRFPVTPPIDFLDEFFHLPKRMHAEDRRHHFLLGDQAATDRRRKSRDRGVARFHVIPVADIEPSEGNKSMQLSERCGARGWKNHRASWLANGTAQGGIFTGNSRGHHPTEPCPKAQSAPKGSGLALGVYGTLTARTLARSSLANPGSDPIPLRIPFPIGPRPKIGFWP